MLDPRRPLSNRYLTLAFASLLALMLTSCAATVTTVTPPSLLFEAQIVTADLGTIAAGGHSPIKDIACPVGYLAASGGIATLDNAPVASVSSPKSALSLAPLSGSNSRFFTLMRNVPISATTWRTEVYNGGSAAADAQVRVECLKTVNLQSQIVTTTLGAIAPGTNSAIKDTACPAGYFVAGGGPTTSGSCYM